MQETASVILGKPDDAKIICLLEVQLIFYALITLKFLAELDTSYYINRITIIDRVLYNSNKKTKQTDSSAGRCKTGLNLCMEREI